MVEAQLKLDYRKDILVSFFDNIKSGDSFYVVGAPSMGKTRLMDFLMGDNQIFAPGQDSEFDRDMVKKYYLGEIQAAMTWLIRVDLDRMSHEYNWTFSFYELLLSAVLFSCSKQPQTTQIVEIKTALASLDSQVLQSKDPLIAHRYFELAMNKLCQEYQIKLCFMFDEFDEAYKNMPREVFAQLRAIRDANKYRLFYALFLRNLPETLRRSTDNEGFYELISRHPIGLGPFNRTDSLRVIAEIEVLRNCRLSTDQHERLVVASGGHPGLLNALFGILKENNGTAQISGWDWYFSQEAVREEFRKLWNGLTDEEKVGLKTFAHGNIKDLKPLARKILVAKGLLKPDGLSLNYFSPLLPLFLETVA
jgi:hypothetical protein